MANTPIKITGSAKMTLSGTSIPAMEFQQFLERVPAEALITVTQYAGDQRGPGTTTIEASWAL